MIIGMILRGAYLYGYSGDPEWHAPALDAAFHDYWANALATGDWSAPRFFPHPEIDSNPYFRPPGYAYFLAIIYWIMGRDMLWPRIAQGILGLVNICLGYRLGLTFLGRVPARVVAAGLSTSWPVIYHECELLAPTLIVFLLLCLLIVTHHALSRATSWGSFAVGVLVGLLSLALPNALVFAPIAWIAIWWLFRTSGDSWRRLILLGLLPLGVTATILPATLRNLRVGQDFVLLTANGGVNLYIGNNEESDGFTPRIPLLGEVAGLQGWTCFDQPAIVRGVERVTGSHLKASGVSAFFAKKAWEFVVANPLLTLRRIVFKAALFLGPLEVANDRELELVRADSAVLRWLPGWSFWFSLALLGAGCWLLVARRSAAPGHILGIRMSVVVIAALFASYLPFFVAGRYRVPLFALLALFAGVYVQWLVGSIKAKKIVPASASLLVWVCIYGLTSLSVTHYRPDPSNHHFQKGDAFRMIGDDVSAIREYRRALALAENRVPMVHNNLGASLLQRGDTEEALRHLKEAVRMAPSYAQARYNLALALAASGSDQSAIAELVRVVALDPSHAAGWLRLGALRLRLGDSRGAVEALRVSFKLAAEGTTKYLLAIALLDVGEVAPAKRLLEELVAESPSQADARVVLAEIFLGEGNVGRALRLIEEAVRIRPDHPGARMLRDRLK
jgi:tetratricopeptide (TPR) repeat protein/4-amino-4-deoxy-L-arabinose transferase-like glycosyltransferase